MRSIGLTETHMECRYLKDSVPVMTDLLAFEKVSERPGEATLKHPNTDWLITLHEAGPDAPPKQMHNHWGVRVATPAEIDAAYDYLAAHKDQYHIDQIGKPNYSHGSYSVYFLEPGTNGWEIECYAEALRNEAWKTRIGGVRGAHWEKEFPAERFPGRGYVPQGFTHGTLACSDLKQSWDFYRDVLGLEVHQANPHVVYVKHPNTKPYVVCAVRPEWKTFSPNFRFTIGAESAQAVEEAHSALAGAGPERGVTEIRDVTRGNGRVSFLFSDPARNWWEVAAQN
jgi:catechol 2,3-dioxygenase-like lactoylglutathione lyase family enzyme